ncbi:acyl carrier protein [Vibrio sp. D420a]|nr:MULTISPECIES: acyl carrier protein [Vibrio]MDK9762851.1 acyl carrier protein [Vibrio sp. D420a]
MVDLEMIKVALGESGAMSDVGGLSLDVTFKEAGFDSLDMFNLFVELEQKTGHQVPDELVEELNTPAAIIEYFSKHS